MRTYCAASYALMRDTLGKLKTGPAVRELFGNPATKCLSGKTPAARFSGANGARGYARGPNFYRIERDTDAAGF